MHSSYGVRHLCVRPFAMFAILTPLLLAAAGAGAQVTLRLDHKDGDHVTDIAPLVAHADSPAGIDKVTFQIDDQPANAIVSVPYKYPWDTLAATEGPHKLTVTAYDAAGRTKSLSISLVVDNGLSVGAAAYAAQARTAFSAQDFDNATRLARRSLKADPGNVAACSVLASIAATNGDWDAAISTLSKASGLDQNAADLRQLAGYKMRRALSPAYVTSFVAELQSVSDLRHKAADLAVKQAQDRWKAGPNGAIPVQGCEEIGDALMDAGRYHEAELQYGVAAESESAPISVQNRLALALAMQGKDFDAITRLRPIERAGQADAVSRAVHALALCDERKYDEARTEIKPEDVDGRVPASLIVASFADELSLRPRAANTEAHAALTLLPNAPEAHYALAMCAASPDEAEQQYAQALMESPFHPGPFVQYAAGIAMSQSRDRWDKAYKIGDFLLQWDKTSVSTRLFQAMILLQEKRFTEADPLLEDLYRFNKDAPDIVMALATYWLVKDNGALVNHYMAAAAQLDKAHFEWQQPLYPMEFVNKVYRQMHYRAGVFLTPAALYPAAVAQH